MLTQNKDWLRKQLKIPYLGLASPWNAPSLGSALGLPPSRTAMPTRPSCITSRLPPPEEPNPRHQHRGAGDHRAH
jgi:hypothetical protein